MTDTIHVDENVLYFKNKKFEYEVREQCGIYDAPITIEDGLKLNFLDCSSFRLDPEDINTLSLFKNIEELSIETEAENLGFLVKFKRLKSIDIVTWGDRFDCSIFSGIKTLEEIFLSGGDISSMDIINLEELSKLPKLHDLSLHEFGSVDLKALEQLKGLKYFFCGWPDKVLNIASIGKLENLEYLELDVVEMENLDFLAHFPDTLEISFCGNNILNEIEITEMTRFTKHDISEVSINGKRISDYYSINEKE